jgi:hypothetical protein
MNSAGARPLHISDRHQLYRRVHVAQWDAQTIVGMPSPAT